MIFLWHNNDGRNQKCNSKTVLVSIQTRFTCKKVRYTLIRPHRQTNPMARAKAAVTNRPIVQKTDHSGTKRRKHLTLRHKDQLAERGGRICTKSTRQGDDNETAVMLMRAEQEITTGGGKKTQAGSEAVWNEMRKESMKHLRKPWPHEEWWDVPAKVGIWCQFKNHYTVSNDTVHCC